MGKLTREDILHIAKLAHLEIPEPDIPVRLAQFNDILSYVEKLNKLNTEGIEPTTQVLSEKKSMGTLLAPDIPGDSFAPDVAMQNAPARQDHFFMIPRMLEEEN